MTEWLLLAVIAPTLACLWLYLWRNPRYLSGAPAYAAAWSLLLLAGLSRLWVPDPFWALAMRRFLLTGFAGLVLAGSCLQARRGVPRWLLPVVIGLGFFQSVTVSFNTLLALCVGALGNAWLVGMAAGVQLRSQLPRSSRLVSRALGLVLLAMALHLLVGDLAVFSGAITDVLQIQVWIGVFVFAGFLQLLYWADSRGQHESALRLQRDTLRRVAHAVADPDPRACLLRRLAEAERVLGIEPLRVFVERGQELVALRARSEAGPDAPLAPRLPLAHPFAAEVLASAEPLVWTGEPGVSVAGTLPVAEADGFAARIGYGGSILGMVTGARPPGASADARELVLDLASEIGRVLGTAASWERQSAQARALEEHGLRLGQMLEAVPAGYLLADSNKSIRHANRRLLDLLRIPASAPIHDLKALADRLAHRIDPDVWLDCLARASPAATDLVLHGPRQVLSITAHPVGPRQAPDDRVWVVRDVTDERELSERVRQMERLETVGTLAGGLAHDFNNQLTAILGNARLVLDGLSPDDPERAALLDLEESARHCAELTNSLLSFARSEKTDVSPVEVPGLVERAVALVRPLLPPGVHLGVHVDADVGSVDADPVQLSRVLTNLLVNARDAVGQSGHIRILASRSAGDLPVVTFEVQDDGVGMTDEVRRRVFEPFFTAREAGRGSGLGLSVVYGIVSAYGGAVDVESSPGLGSSFRVHWPVHTDGLDEELPPALGPPRRATVLLAEDQAPVRRLVRNALERAGFSVHECADGREALERYRALDGAVDLALFDLSMPRLDGLQALAELRRERPDLPALVMSGHPDRDRGSDAWPDDVPLLAKPFGPRRLVAAVRRSLAS